MSLRDELVENKRVAFDPLVRVIFRREMLTFSRFLPSEHFARKMTRTKGSDAARSFSTSSSRSDILLLSEM